MVYSIKPPALSIDQNQARTQLELLGYKPGDNVYMRFFVPDGDHRHGTPAAARKASLLNWKEVERYQNDGYGVYFVVNGGGHKDKDVTKGRALFCEWDDLPIEDQIFAWQNLNLPEPSLQVGTRKSVHNYWRADLTKEQWIELQEDLLIYTQSDQKLKNPSRVLRLAGAYHIKPGCEPVKCDIIHQSDKVYTYVELRAVIPHRQQPQSSTNKFSTINHLSSITDNVPLYQFLTKDDRALIDQGAGQGSRNDSGAKLARNLIGTAQQLNHLGIQFDGGPRQLFDDYCHRCNPSLAVREAEAIWKSAQKSNPTPSLTDDALKNCAAAWLRNHVTPSGRGLGNGNGSVGVLDIADWIADYKLSASESEATVMSQEELREKIQQQLLAVVKNETAKKFDKSKKPKKAQIPPANVTADAIAEIYRDKLAWESEYKLWRHYGAKHDGEWAVETIESVRGLIHAFLRSLPDEPAFSSAYVSNVLTILQSDLEAKDWNEQQGLIPLQDGVLNQETLLLLPHSCHYRFTWQLPFKWADRDIGCDPIEEFLLKIAGNKQIAEVLLCYLSAIVTRRADLQRYLELIGGGGTGKSTYMALAKALAGDENAVSSQLRLLESNQFETAKFYRKLLVLFPDSERWQGEVSVLKQLTGQDPIRYERKGIQQCRDYVYEGMVILSANEAPESSDRTSGQERRKLTIGLDNRIPEYEGRNLAQEFRPYLPGLLKRVLEISPERVTALVKHTEKNVPALAQKKWAQMIETNPIAAWVDECLVFEPNAKTYIGIDNPEQSGRWLYANFCQFQKNSGHKGTLPVKRFSSNLRDLLKNQMKVSIVEGRDRNGSYIQGVGLRCFFDPNGTHYSRPITKDECDGFEEKCDGFVTDETIGSDGCDGCDGLIESSQVLENTKEVNNVVEGLEINSALREVSGCSENPSHPSQPDAVIISPVTQPITQPVTESVTQPITQPITEPITQDDVWMTEENLQSMADSLMVCDDAQTVSVLRELWHPQAMNMACKLITPEKHAKSKQWVIELNQKALNQ
jgi:phage/plasmid-associated DNA primase